MSRMPRINGRVRCNRVRYHGLHAAAHLSMHDAQRICNILWSMLRVALELSEGQKRNPYTSERRERIVSSKYIYSIM